MAGNPNFLFTWNVTFESQPQDSESESLGASRIRDLKVAIHERLALDHSWAGDANDGKHKQVQMPPSVNPPNLDPGDGCLYTWTSGGQTELVYRKSGADIFLTSGALPAAAFQQGTKMIFMQLAVPTGWGLDTGFVDRTIRIVGNDGTNNGGDVGGSWIISGLVVGGTALQVGHIPPHFHGIDLWNGAGANPVPSAGTNGHIAQGVTTSGAEYGLAGVPHDHPIFSSGTWRPAYANGIVCVKQ